MKQKLTLFERLILFVIVEAMYVAGIPVVHRKKLGDFIYRIAVKGEIDINDLNHFTE
jgi:hypothetical protein